MASKQSYKKCAYTMPDDLVFPKATVDPKLLRLQASVTEFVTTVILKHEREFFDLVSTHFPNKSELLLNTNPSIIEMITRTTNKFYNTLYHQIQNHYQTEEVLLIHEMCDFTDYGPHILLDKLLRLTLEIHLDIWRENLEMGDDYSIYETTILNEINVRISSYNLLHIMSKGPNDDTVFINLPDGQDAFNIVIDKNISM